MYKIEKSPSGFLLAFGGQVTADEMTRCHQESLQALVGATPPFGVIIDMHTLIPLALEVQSIMVEGMKRSCAIVPNSIVASQFKRLVEESGIYAFERYIDTSACPDWTKVAVAWVKDGSDPDL
jgi:hypothetical protein